MHSPQPLTHVSHHYLIVNIILVNIVITVLIIIIIIAMIINKVSTKFRAMLSPALGACPSLNTGSDHHHDHHHDGEQ